MTSLKLAKIVILLISTTAIVVNGNLITLDGQCPFADLKPVIIPIGSILNQVGNVTFNVIALTAPLNGMNRTDLTATLDNPNVFRFTQRFRSTETGQCTEILSYLKDAEEPGAYDVLYQVAPETNFVKFAGYFLSKDPVTLKSVGILCHNLPNSKFQVEVFVLSVKTIEYDEATQEYANRVLQNNNLGETSQYLRKMERTKKC